MSRIKSQKRQKEAKRKEKQLAKAARRAQKKSAQREIGAINHNTIDVPVTAPN
ncbi:MAG TPA: hypothetical protein VFB23_03755 [Candidatus Acidoferrales bacterium]|jgi:hypothetical protein|nr:hypothetical protein [Candidatus Acidoferrales bacterium]